MELQRHQSTSTEHGAKLSARFIVVIVAIIALLFVAAAALSTPVSAGQKLRAGWQIFAVSEDMTGKKVSELPGTCSFSLLTPFDTTKQSWAYPFLTASSTITAEMVGKGLLAKIPEATECELNTKGYADHFGAAAELTAGFNLLSIPKSMMSKSFDDVAGDCQIDMVLMYYPEACSIAGFRSNPHASGTCLNEVYYRLKKDYTIDATSASSVIGKGVVVKAKSDCTLNDGQVGEVSGVNLQPDVETLKVTVKSDGTKEKTAATVVKAGDTIEVVFYVKNTGTKSTNAEEVLRRCNTATTSCKISTVLDIGIQSGSSVIPLIQTASRDINPLFNPATEEIKPGNAGKLEVARKTITIPESSQGNVVITAILTPQSGVEDAGNVGDNRKTVTLAVEGLGLPNLVATAAEPVPTLETIPVILSSVRIKIKNIGERDAVAGKQFLENKVTVLKGNAEICSGYIRNLLTIKHGEETSEEQLPSVDVKFAGGNPCPIDDKNANYWVAVNVDTYQASDKDPIGVVTESNEDDNKQTFQLKGPQQCTPLGSRQAGKYCSISTGTWLTQKGENQQCTHNFECQTELCIKQKCVPEKQKQDILKLLGIS